MLQRLQTVIKNAEFQLQVSRSGRNALAVLYWRSVRRASGPVRAHAFLHCIFVTFGQVPGGHAALRLHSSLYRKRLEVFIAPAAPAEERGACNCLPRVETSVVTISRCPYSRSVYVTQPLFTAAFLFLTAIRPLTCANPNRQVHGCALAPTHATLSSGMCL